MRLVCKKTIFTVMFILLISLCGCNLISDSNNTKKDNSNYNGSSSTITTPTENDIDIDSYYSVGASSYRFEKDFFNQYLTAKEYIDICTELKKYNAVPLIALGKSVFVVKQDFSTYDTREINYSIMNSSGKILKDYGNNSWVDKGVRMGDFTFLYTKGNPATFDVVNNQGVVVNTFDNCTSNQILEHFYDFGDGNHLFLTVLSGNYELYLLKPNGEINIISNYFDLDIYYLSLIKDDAVEIGNICEDKFSFLYSSGGISRAFYFNIDSKRGLDFSSDEKRYKVYELGDFENGQAQIKFTGVDYESYLAVIDAEGNFIGEPKKITN